MSEILIKRIIGTHVQITNCYFKNNLISDKLNGN